MGASQAQFDEAVKLVGEMVIPECPRAQSVSRALTGLILVLRQYLREPDAAGLQGDIQWILPAIEMFAEVLEPKVPPSRVQALEGVLSLLMAQGESGAAEGVDLGKVTTDLRLGA
jgi:hypothetical protein